MVSRFSNPALSRVEVFKGLEARECFAGFLEGSIHTQNAVVRDGRKPSILNLKNVQLLVLLEIVSQGVPREVDGANVTRRQTLRIPINPAHIQKLGVPTLPDAELMDAEIRRERVPRLDQLDIWQLTRLPANRLYWQAIHCPRNLRLVKAHLELKACRLLAPHTEDVRLQVFPLASLMVLGELFSDKATDDGWQVGENVGHGIGLR